MALLYSTELAGVGGLPPVVKPNLPYGGRRRRYRATITLASQATTDWILLAQIPAGYWFDGGSLTSSVTLGTSVIAIGTNAVHASNGQYRAAAVFTTTDQPTGFGVTAAMAGGMLTTQTNVFLTIATAALPSSGTLVVNLDFVGG